MPKLLRFEEFFLETLTVWNGFLAGVTHSSSFLKVQKYNFKVSKKIKAILDVHNEVLYQLVKNQL
jgi:hypothetical protein